MGEPQHQLVARPMAKSMPGTEQSSQKIRAAALPVAPSGRRPVGHRQQGGGHRGLPAGARRRYRWASRRASVPSWSGVVEIERAATACRPLSRAWQHRQLLPPGCARRQRRCATEAKAGLQPAALRARNSADLLRRLNGWRMRSAACRMSRAERVPEPNMIDKVGQLPTGTAPPMVCAVSLQFGASSSTTRPPRRCHTGAAGRSAGGPGRPGITYRYRITGDGAICATQALDVVPARTGKTGINQGEHRHRAGRELHHGSAAGSAALLPAANLIAWLLSRFSLTTTEVVGRRELENVNSRRSASATLRPAPSIKCDHRRHLRSSSYPQVGALCAAVQRTPRAGLPPRAGDPV